jgi:HSP20 family protein
MTRDLIRLMHALFLPVAEAGQDAWAPPADIYRTPDGWLVKLELAGIRPEDVVLEVHGQRLRVRGVRRDCILEKGCRCYQMEIDYGHFDRTLELPCLLEQCRYSTDYRDGMLLIHIQPEDCRDTR